MRQKLVLKLDVHDDKNKKGKAIKRVANMCGAYLQKLFLKLDVRGDKNKRGKAMKRGKNKRRAMKWVGAIDGVQFIELRDRKMIVMGDVDAVEVVKKLRNLCYTELLSVGPADKDDERGDSMIGDDDGSDVDDNDNDDDKNDGGGVVVGRRRVAESDRGNVQKSNNNNMKSDPSGHNKSSYNSGSFQQLGGYQQWRKNAMQNRMLIILLLCLYYFKLRVQQRSTAILHSVSAPLSCCNFELISTAAINSYAVDAN